MIYRVLHHVDQMIYRDLHQVDQMIYRVLWRSTERFEHIRRSVRLVSLRDVWQ